MIAPARRAAYHVLRAVNERRADLPQALAHTRASLRDARDRALASEIATGTLRWQGTLDYLVAHFARRPAARLDPEVLDILRLSIYQLLHLNRVPAAAAVHDAVELARRAGKGSATGLVNAVLRAITRERQQLPLPEPPEFMPSTDPLASDADGRLGGARAAALDYLSITLSHPRWLVERWLDRHGFAIAAAWARFNNTPAPLTLRVNRLKIRTGDLVDALAAHAVIVRPTRYAPDGLVVTRGNPLTTPLADRGWFIVQDEASQLVAALARVQPGDRVLDACASPGGKTLALAAMMENRGLLVATDLRDQRLDLLRQTVTRCAATSVRLVQMDLREPLPFGERFDCVFVDVPCSGLGTIRRDPEIRWRRTETDLDRLARVQLAMLDRAAGGVRPGGRLIYATCSSEPEENERVVEQFLAAHGEFRLLRAGSGPDEVLPGLESVVDQSGYLRTDPHAHGLEAFFGALLARGPAAPTL